MTSALKGFIVKDTAALNLLLPILWACLKKKLPRVETVCEKQQFLDFYLVVSPP